MATSISLITTGEFPAYSTGARHYSACVTVTALANTVGGAKQRIGLVLAVDTSGSMGESVVSDIRGTPQSSGHAGLATLTKLQAAQHALRGLFDVAARNEAVDVIATLIAYSTTATIVLDKVSLSSDNGLARALAAVAGLMDGGETNMDAALGLARTAAQSIATGGGDVHVFLFTDGQASLDVPDPSSSSTGKTMRITQKQMAERLVASATALAKDKTPLHAMAFGTDADMGLMNKLAAAGTGHFYDSSDLEAMAVAFGICLGTGIAMAARNLELTITPPEGGRLHLTTGAAIALGQYVSESYEPAGAALVLPLKDMVSGESRNVLIELQLAFKIRDRDFTASLVYTARGADTPSTLATTFEMMFVPPGSIYPATSAPVLKARARLDVAASIAEAARLAAASLEEARACIRACQVRLSDTDHHAGLDPLDLELLNSQLNMVLAQDLASREHYTSNGMRSMELRVSENHTESSEPSLGLRSGYLSRDVRALTMNVAASASLSFAESQYFASDDSDADVIATRRAAKVPRLAVSGSGITAELLNLGICAPSDASAPSGGLASYMNVVDDN